MTDWYVSHPVTTESLLCKVVVGMGSIKVLTRARLNNIGFHRSLGLFALSVV